MKMYHWGFDLAGYSSQSAAVEFLKHSGFIEVFHGYDPFRKDNAGSPYEHGFVYLNPDGVILVTERESWKNGDMGYVGLSSFSKKALDRVLYNLKNVTWGGGYMFVYKNESPGRRDYI